MKIALIGYGKMGKIIDRIATERGHQVIAKIDVDTQHLFTQEYMQYADVAIEFSQPEAALDNIIQCLKLGTPIVSGTTGWLARFEEVKKTCIDYDGAFFYASNFSIGVNLFFVINRQVAKLMNEHPEYEVSMHETHHTQKLDHPSGTAITLAEGILDNIERKKSWKDGIATQADELGIVANRIDPTPGTHQITYSSMIDRIDLIHTAHSREGFANGAVQAAEWLMGKKGIFSMEDMLKISFNF